jgi:hypothetical protein
MIHARTASEANLENHKPACKGPPKGVARKITDMFAPKACAPLVPSMGCAAPLITSASTSSIENDASFGRRIRKAVLSVRTSLNASADYTYAVSQQLSHSAAVISRTALRHNLSHCGRITAAWIKDHHPLRPSPSPPSSIRVRFENLLVRKVLGFLSCSL